MVTGRRPSIVNDILEIVDYMEEYQCTTRKAAEHFGITHSAINYNIKNKLEGLDPVRYAKTIALLARNKLDGPSQSREGSKAKPTTREMKAKHMRGDKCAPPEPLYIAMEDLDFTFYHFEIADVIEMWVDGRTLDEISRKMKRDPDEVAILLMDLARKKKIPKRQDGVFGGNVMDE